MSIKNIYCALVVCFLPILGYSQANKADLLQIHTWGLHNITRIDSAETDEILGDSDARITFKSDDTLLEYDSGIKRNYNWKIIDGALIEIKKIGSELPEKYKSFLRLEQIRRIEKLDGLNLVLTTDRINGVQYRYHYRRF